MDITPKQIVDAVRLLRYASTFIDENEADRLGEHAEIGRQRYEELIRTALFEECDMIASAEMLANVLGISSAGIEAEVRERFRRQLETWKDEVRAERAAQIYT